MLYKFKSQAAADVIMTQSSAEELLQIIGKAPGPAGIITVEQIPAAIAALQKAVAQSEADEQAARKQQQALGEEPVSEDAIQLHRRAAPFIELLRQSASENKDVVWGV